MPAPTAHSETARITAGKTVMVSSTTKMLVLMEQGLGKTLIPTTTPYFINEIAGNRDLMQVQKTMNGLKEDRNSLFRVKAEVDVLISSLEKSALKPELKNSLALRAKDLLNIIDQTTVIDTRFNSLEEGLAALEAQRFKSKQAHYREIATAANPREKAAQLLKTEKTSQATLQEYKDKVTQDTKLFQYLLKKIEGEYTYLRDATPGNLGMRTFQALSAPAPATATASTDPQSAVNPANGSPLAINRQNT